MDGTLVIADQAMASDTVDGAVQERNFVLSEATPNTLDGTQEVPSVGQVIDIGATGEHAAIHLTLDS